MDLTVLGCSGSYGAPAGGACSGYLVRAGDANIWMDCGNGTFANLQQHIDPAELERGGYQPRSCRPLRRHLRTPRAVPLRPRPQWSPGVHAGRPRAGARGTGRQLRRHLRVADGRRRRQGLRGRSAAAVLAYRPSAAHGRGRDRARRQAIDLHRRHRTRVDGRRVRRRCRSRALRGDVPARRHSRADPPLRAPGRRARRAKRARAS